jgi:Trk K+ transport system NAD-binding subunit
VAIVVRDDAVVPATGDLMIEPGDRLLVFAAPSAVKRLQAFLK